MSYTTRPSRKFRIGDQVMHKHDLRAARKNGSETVPLRTITAIHFNSFYILNNNQSELYPSSLLVPVEEDEP